MKNVFKVLGIIALVAVIGFGFVSCGGDDDGGGGLKTLSGDVTVSPSANVTTGTLLTAAYSGDETVTYQWKKGATNVGTNSNKYTPPEAGSYTVTASAAGYNSKTSAAVDVTGDTLTQGLAFTPIKSNTAYSVAKGTTDAAQVVIPAEYEGKPVTAIAEQGFRSYTGMTSVTIPDSVTSIGSSAFSGCTGLISVTIPDSVTSIDQFAFNGCTGLTSVTIGNGVTSLSGFDFRSYPNLTSVIIGNGVTGIGRDDFKGCTSLTSVTIGNGVTRIGGDDSFLYGAFNGCTSLVSVTFSVPSKVASIEDYAFSGCTSLASITIPDSVTRIGQQAFEGTALLNNQPDGVVYVGKWACAYKGDMPDNTTITLLDGTKGIADRAFYFFSVGAKSTLISITIPDSVTSIGSSAFAYTSLTSVTIPDSVTSIGRSAFSNCTGLTGSLTIPNGVTRIEEGAFSGTGLTSVTIPDSVTGIGKGAFAACGGLTSVTIPSRVTIIGNNAFYNCTGLTSVTIPDSVTSIGMEAFYGCTGLTSVTFQGKIASVNFNSTSPFPGDLRAKYLAANGGIGTYTTTTPVPSNPSNWSPVWTKQP